MAQSGDITIDDVLAAINRRFGRKSL